MKAIIKAILQLFGIKPVIHDNATKKPYSIPCLGENVGCTIAELGKPLIDASEKITEAITEANKHYIEVATKLSAGMQSAGINICANK